jgi:hypothetical protein
MTPEEAKARSERFLERHGLAVNPQLPPLVPIDELEPPSAQQAAQRSLVLGYLVGVSYDVPRRTLARQLQHHGLWGAASAEEQALLTRGRRLFGRRYSEQEKTESALRTECVQLLGWGLGLVELDPFRPRDEELYRHFPIHADPESFVASATLRPADEIYAQCDLHYRLGWACLEARHRAAPVGLDCDVLRERQRAVNWLVGVESDWDRVPTDL